MSKNKIIDGLKDAVRSARCQHTFVTLARHPNGEPKTKRCIRCETVFHIPSSKEIVQQRGPR